MKLRIDFNAPVTLTYTLICCVVLMLIAVFGEAFAAWFVCPPRFSFGSVDHYFRTCSYIFGHANVGHLMGNMSFILLLGPILEEKYGAKPLVSMIGITALVTAIINYVFIQDAIIGASGIVFMLIILISFANFKEGSIPLTFILILILFIGKEVVHGFQENNVSEFGHIAGGVCGSLFGFRRFDKLIFKE